MNAIFLTLSAIITLHVSAQNVGINGTGGSAHPSALLDIDAVATPSLGVLIPRIALQATNLAAPVTAPATSLLVYNTATASTGTTAVIPGYYFWDGAKWASFNTSNNTTTASSSGCAPTMVSTPSLATNYWNCLSYCSNLIEGGFSDWKVPSVSEYTDVQTLFTILGNTGSYIWTKDIFTGATNSNGSYYQVLIYDVNPPYFTIGSTGGSYQTCRCVR